MMLDSRLRMQAALLRRLKNDKAALRIINEIIHLLQRLRREMDAVLQVDLKAMIVPKQTGDELGVIKLGERVPQKHDPASRLGPKAQCAQLLDDFAGVFAVF